MTSPITITIVILLSVFLIATAVVDYFPQNQSNLEESQGKIIGGGKGHQKNQTSTTVITSTTTTSSTSATSSSSTSSTTSSSTTTTIPAGPFPYTQHEKGLHIEPNVIFSNLPMPSFSDLKKGNFTIIGTSVSSTFSSSNWNTVSNWINSVHNAGFRAMVRVYEDPTTDVTLTKKAASIGADVVWYDELISRFNMTQQQTNAILDAGLSVKPNLQFALTEYTPDNIANAYNWTANYPSARVITDDYDTKGIIDLGIFLAGIYGKRPLVWLIFVPGSQNFDCYNNLPDWISYVEQHGEDTFFWYVDGSQNWQKNWPLLMNFSTSNPVNISSNFSIPPNLIPNPSFEGSTYQLDANNANFQDWEISRVPDNGIIYTWIETSNTHSEAKAFHWKIQAPSATNLSLAYYSNSSKKFLVNESGYLEAGAWAYTISSVKSNDISMYFYSSNGTFLGRFWGKDQYNYWLPNIWSSTSFMWYPSSMGTGNGYIPQGAKYGKLNIYEDWHTGGTLERIEDDVFVRQWDHSPSYQERNSSAYSS